MIPRDRATWATILGLATMSVIFFMEMGITPLTMALGFLSTSSGASTAIRYQMTEACVTRVQTAYMLMTSGAMAHQSQLGAPEVPPSSFRPQQGVRVEREDG